jgi:helitron helicase-like protein
MMVPFTFYRLFQQYIVDIWALCDQSALDWIRFNQKQLRADVYSGVADAIWRIFKGRAILTVRNDTVTAVNRDLIGQLPGDAMDFPSVDT